MKQELTKEQLAKCNICSKRDKNVIGRIWCGIHSLSCENLKKSEGKEGDNHCKG